jgi:Toxin SymE, type I toxin-antitoxin system
MKRTEVKPISVKPLQCERCRKLAALSRRHPLTDDQGRRRAKIHTLFRRTAFVPMLRLSGNWLAAPGFPRDQELIIETRPKELVIRAL